MRRLGLVLLTLGWGGLIVLGMAIFLGIAIFGGTSMGKATDATLSAGPSYRWNGEPMLITTSARRVAACRVTPDQGPPRDVNTYRSEAKYRVDRIQPWFSGAATMRCSQQVKIRAGADLSRYELATKNRIFQVGVPVIAAAPFLLVTIFGGRKKTPGVPA